VSKVVLVVGTGTIGEPLIAMLARARTELGIDKLLFYKRTPLLDEKAKVESLCSMGAMLVVTNESMKSRFEDLGHQVYDTFENALINSDVVIDCTPAGNEMKEKYYIPIQDTHPKDRLFIAQGSEKGFGVPYAYGINDEVLDSESPSFIQVVSCNTHNIACLLKSFSDNFSNIVMGDFVCIRRANDVSQRGSFIASPEVGEHSDELWGTHHARDAADLIATVAEPPNLYSSAMKVNSQYMHVIRFSIVVEGALTQDDILKRLGENKMISLTQKTQSGRVFSFGRDHGQYGRIYNHTVIPTVTLQTQGGESSEGHNGTRITGFCFTPQDGNSLISSTAAMLHGIHGDKRNTFDSFFDKMLYDEL